MIQPIVHFHECADPTPIASTAKSAPTKSTADPAPAKSMTAESVVEPLHSVADSASGGAAPTETS
jgi:hypothetical protein